MIIRWFPEFDLANVIVVGMYEVNSFLQKIQPQE